MCRVLSWYVFLGAVQWTLVKQESLNARQVRLQILSTCEEQLPGLTRYLDLTAVYCRILCNLKFLSNLFLHPLSLVSVM